MANGLHLYNNSDPKYLSNAWKAINFYKNNAEEDQRLTTINVHSQGSDVSDIAASQVRLKVNRHNLSKTV